MVKAGKKSKVSRPKPSKAKKVKITTNRDGIMFASIDGIDVEDGFNIRSNVTPERELVDSVKVNGVCHAVDVRWKHKKKERLSLIDGERRLAAAKEAGLGSIPIAHHGFMSDKEARVLSLVGNRNQKKWTRKELLKGFRELKKCGLSPGQISKVMVVDARTVDEALRVEAKGSKELKTASKKGSKKGGVAPRAAARASHLPKAEQKKLVKKMAGKPMEEQLEAVRKTEKRLGISRPGRKKATPKPAKPKGPKLPKNYRLADDFAARCEALEKELSRKLIHAPSHRVHTGQMMIIKCLKGQCEVTDVFGWKNV
jgi:ParB-like chromosome segregation protein Spo0J